MPTHALCLHNWRLLTSKTAPKHVFTLTTIATTDVLDTRNFKRFLNFPRSRTKVACNRRLGKHVLLVSCDRHHVYRPPSSLVILFFFNHRFHGKNVSVTYFLEPFTGISYNIKVATILLRSNVLSDYMEGRFATCVRL